MCLLNISSEFFNIFGLSLDIIGVVLLFVYGVQSDPFINKEGEELKSMSLLPDKKVLMIKKWKKYDNRSKLGLGLIIVGFLFQIVSNLV
jgi:hypothetical protein